MATDMGEILLNELKSLENIHGQNIDTGQGLNGNDSFISAYTNRLFGAPFQLMNSVDRRFEKVNPATGNQYLRNILLSSPILHIKPGMPKYTGKQETFEDLMKQVFMDAADGDFSGTATELAKDLLFSAGNKLQRRMFGFKETYKEYMNHVNYMCRSMANFLTLTSGKDFPAGAVSNDKENELESFDKFKWENYRMLSNVKAQSASEMLGDMAGASTTIQGLGYAGTAVASGLNTLLNDTAASLAAMTGGISNEEYAEILGDNANNFLSDMGAAADNVVESLDQTIQAVLDKQVTAVMFMVEPGSFSEELTNEVGSSTIETTIDGIHQGLGQEIAFMTGSNVDLGVIDDMASFLGNTATGVTDFVAGLVEPASGGFVHNVFTGALNSLKGQKMIYPSIYKSSNSKMDYNFTVNLSTPYGDTYNYYMHIVVPLMHLIALTAPRLVSANSVTSPYIVQAFIPGMCTCQMGIITNMTITKNPNGNRVSVHGFPLDVQVKFTITELYNAMAISPSTDPASFLFNETLNDYMANLGGIIPCRDTYSKKKENAYNNLETYFSGEAITDITQGVGNVISDFVTPTGMR